MKKIFVLAFYMIVVSCNTGRMDIKETAAIKLTVSSSIDRQTPINKKLIETLSKFLETKNNSHYKNKYWLEADFKTFYFPYLDIFNIEHKDSILNFFKPTLMEIVKTENEDMWLLKLAFISHDESTEENDIKCIYNIMATKRDSNIILSNPLPYLTRDWTKIKKDNILYIISPQRQFNENEADRQLVVIKKINEFYNTGPQSITYYSCINPKELFKMKGFDYTPMMYVEGGGGLSSHHNIIFSANNTEIYTHEIIHLYNIALFPSIPKLINEGMATYVGGSRTFSYAWHKENLKNHLKTNTKIDLSKHLEPFERFYVGNTSIPYMIGALICERTYRLYGREKLISLLSRESEFWELLNGVGLTKENLDIELKKELVLSPLLIF